MNLIINEQVGKVQVQLPGRMSDAEFFAFCRKNPELNLERDASGNILVMEPVNMLGGRLEIKAATALETGMSKAVWGRYFHPVPALHCPT